MREQGVVSVPLGFSAALLVSEPEAQQTCAAVGVRANPGLCAAVWPALVLLLCR